MALFYYLFRLYSICANISTAKIYNIYVNRLCAVYICASRCRRYNKIEKEGDFVVVSKAQQKAVNGYISRNYDRINLTVPKGQKVAIEAHAKGKGLSTNALLNELLRADMGVSESDWKAKNAADPLEE